ncbi:DUF4743 domain-containing protein [uncultured Gammaproteobacteria bacterium]
MAFIDHIRACNRHDLSGFRPWLVAGVRVGWVRHALAERLLGFAKVFQAGAGDQLLLNPALGRPEDRSAAVAVVAESLAAEGRLSAPIGELYPVLARWGTAPLLCLDRAVAASFGIRAYGLHVNGFVRRADGGVDLWIGHRARDRKVAPGQLDNMIAGGQPAGLSLRDNLLKEAREEAGLGAAIAGRACPVGALSYVMETPAGLRPDVLFLYDLEMHKDEIPSNEDGEVERFELVPVDLVAKIVRDTNEFKFNCNLVIIDFLFRHGNLDPDHKDYLEILAGLRSEPPQ